MRRKLVLGVSLTMFAGSAGVGQDFGVDRPPTPAPMSAPKATPAAIPGGLQPVTPGRSMPIPGGLQPATPTQPVRAGGYVPPVGGFQPAGYGSYPTGETRPVASMPVPINIEMPSALGPNHPWQLKPEHGPYFILVKSYVRPAKSDRPNKYAQDDPGLSARELAEGLASEIRETYRVQAFLYEYITEERKAEMRSIIAARQKAAAYAAQWDAMRQKAQLQGMEFLEPDRTLHIRTHHHRDQIGVLVGGFQSEADATKALAQLKKWPAPKNEMLMDGGAIVKLGPDGKTPIIEKTRLNPYSTAFVVPNPAVVKPEQPGGGQRGLDPFIVKLNEGNPYSLFKAKKGWTLAVKSFSAPVEIVNKNSDNSLMRKMGFTKGSDVLAAGAEQAEQMAKALRQMRGPGTPGQPGPLLNLEAFVLHTRNASLVTIGQFDGPDDPALHNIKQLLSRIKLEATEDIGRTRPAVNTPAVFGNLVPMPIPKP